MHADGLLVTLPCVCFRAEHRARRIFAALALARAAARALANFARITLAWVDTARATAGLLVAVDVVLVVVDVLLVAVVTVTGVVEPDAVTTQVGAEPLLDVQATVEPVLIVLLVQTAVALSVAVQLWVELSLVVLDAEVPLLEAQVVVVPLPEVLTVQPGAMLAALTGPLELLELNDEPPLLELEELPPLELEYDPLELLEELEEVPPCARASRTGESEVMRAKGPDEPARSSAARGRATRRMDAVFLRTLTGTSLATLPT